MAFNNPQLFQYGQPQMPQQQMFAPAPQQQMFAPRMPSMSDFEKSEFFESFNSKLDKAKS